MNKTLRWTLFALFAIISAFFALVAAIEAEQAASGHFQKGAAEGDTIGAALVSLLIAGIFAWLARSAEHHARTGQSLRTSITKGLTLNALPHQRRVAPHSRVSEVVVLALMTLIYVSATVIGFADWRRSVETQHHGISASGSVHAVVAVTHSSRYSDYVTYDYDVSLSAPVKGRSSTVVHTPDGSAVYNEGETVEVLVDPADPGYAELPGDPASDAAGAFVPLGLAVAFGLLVLVGQAKARARRRAQAPKSASGPGGHRP